MGCAPSASTADYHPIWGRFTRYRILGQGASASVWLAMERGVPSTEEAVSFAVKLIHKSNKFARVLYEQEFNILKLMSHPNILQFVDSMESPDEFAIVTQYLPGGEMFDRIRELHHYTEKMASDTARQMLRALHYCHKHNIVHRDLKPENYVYATRLVDSELKLIDFGGALHIADDEVHEDGIGTPYYIAPEIIDADFNQPRTGKVLKCADMWSLGVIFFMMLTGKPPFRGKNDDEIYDCVMIGEYQWPIEIQVSEQAKDLVAKLLTRDHTKRMTAAEALNHPWIANHETLSDVSLTAALKSIKDFSVAAKMKKAVAMLLIKELTPDETAKLYRLFDELDTDGDRLLDLAEMTLYMSQHGHEKPSDAQAAAKTFMDAADESKRGAINFFEFQNAHMRGQLGSDAVAIRKAFDAIDKDKSGYIDLHELRELLGTDSADTIAELVREIDKDGAGKIPFQTFFAAMTSENLKQVAVKMDRHRGWMSSSRRNLLNSSKSLTDDKLRRVNSFAPHDRALQFARARTTLSSTAWVAEATPIIPFTSS